MSYPQEVKDRAYRIDPECWEPYSGMGRNHKAAMDYRRTASLMEAERDFNREKESEVTTETQAPIGANYDPEKAQAKSFCVIGPSVNSSIGRTWKATKEEASAHAEKLIRNSFDGSRSKIQRLLVVQVVEVIEVAGPPITRRTMTADDVDSQEGD